MAEFGEHFGKREGQPLVDTKGFGGELWALDGDGNLDAATGNDSEHGLADVGVQFVEFAGGLDDDFRLLAVHGADFYGGVPGVRCCGTAAKSCHGVHGGRVGAGFPESKIERRAEVMFFHFQVGRP